MIDLMSTERSDRVHAQYLEALQKFDYFVAGLSLALVGYLGQAFQPTEIGWNSATIELLSIVLLLISAISGLKRIETNVTLLGVSHLRLYAQEVAGTAASAAATGGAAVNTSTGDFLSPDQLARDAQEHHAGAEIAKKKLDELTTKTMRWYRVRNTCLIGGLGLLVIARALPVFVA